MADHPPTLARMTGTEFKPGDDVVTPRAVGTVIDVRPSPTGVWLYGVEDADDVVTYYTAKALRPVE